MDKEMWQYLQNLAKNHKPEPKLNLEPFMEEMYDLIVTFSSAEAGIHPKQYEREIKQMSKELIDTIKRNQ